MNTFFITAPSRSRGYRYIRLVQVPQHRHITTRRFTPTSIYHVQQPHAFPSEYLQAALPLWPLLSLFKSSAVLRGVGTLTRAVAVLFYPLRSARFQRLWYGPSHEISSASSSASSSSAPLISRIVIYSPLALLALTLVSSFERTPFSGRWRFIPFSSEEERVLLDDFMLSRWKRKSPYEWNEVLNKVLGRESTWTILTPADWRVVWVEGVLRRLEHGATAEKLNEAGSPINGLAPRALSYPIQARKAAFLSDEDWDESEPMQMPIVTNYGLLVVDEPICNAFTVSLGVQTRKSGAEVAPGVIVVYTGLLDKIMSTPSSTEAPPSQALRPPAWYNIFRPMVAPAGPMQPVPSAEHTADLAIILAHELSHALLAHSLETITSADAFSIFTALFVDLVRTALYPLTFVLGPIGNDWLAQRMHGSAEVGMQMAQSCQSRSCEKEADLLGLRILWNAGFDPRAAIPFWRSRIGSAYNGGMEQDTDAEVGAMASYFDTHPENEERSRAIDEELSSRWTLLGQRS